MNLFEDVYETCLATLIKIKSMEIIDNKLIGELLAKAGASARLRQNLDLRTSGARRLDEHVFAVVRNILNFV